MIALAATTLRDWAKVPLLLAGRWPRPLPPQTITSTALDVALYVHGAQGMPRVAIDVEGDKAPTVIGLAAVGAKWTLLIDWTGADAGHRIAIANILTAWFLFVPVVGHWVARDIAMLENVGVRFDRIDDSGIAHAVAHPGKSHSLVSACSVYGQYGWIKGTSRHTQGDVLGCLDVWYGVERLLGPSKIAGGVELNTKRHRYEWHRTTTLPAAIRMWREGREVNMVPSVDATWTKETA